MVRCERCSARITSASGWCRACGNRNEADEPIAERAPEPVPAAAGGPAVALPAMPSSADAVMDPGSRRYRPKSVTSGGPPPLPPITGQYEPPRYNPAPPPKPARSAKPPRKAAAAPPPPGATVHEPSKVPVAFLIVVALLIVGLGAGAFVLNRRVTSSDSGALAQVGSTPGSWAPWAAPDGTYLVSFPGRPLYDTRPTTTQPDGAPVVTADATLDVGTAVYRATTIDLPPSSRAARPDADVLLATLEGLRAERPGLDVAVAPIDTWSGMPSVAFSGTVPGWNGVPDAIVGRVAVDDDHVFVLLVSARDASANADKFLGSFQRLD